MPCRVGKLQPLIVLDVNGVHIVDVIFCSCDDSSKYIQLMQARWYPATVKNPQTVFTFAVLDLFHEITLQGKISAHDFYQSLLHVSDNAGVEGYPVRRFFDRVGIKLTHP